MNTQYLHELKQPGIKFIDPANTEMSRREIEAYFKQLELLRLDFIEHISSCRESVALAYFDTVVDVRKILRCYNTHVIGPASKELSDWLSAFPAPVVHNPSLMSRIVSGYSQSIETTLDFLHTISPVDAFKVAEGKNDKHEDEADRAPLFFDELQVPEENLPTVFAALQKEHLIARDTAQDVFLFYFTGQEPKPTKRIRWVGSLTLLVLFLKKMSADKRIWMKAATIFETIKKGETEFSVVSSATLRSSFSQAPLQDKYKENMKAIARITGKE